MMLSFSCACVLVTQSCLFVSLWTVACQSPLSMGYFRKEYWSGLPFPSPGDLPDLGIEPAFPVSPALQAVSLPAEPLGKPFKYAYANFQRCDSHIQPHISHMCIVTSVSSTSCCAFVFFAVLCRVQ